MRAFTIWEISRIIGITKGTVSEIVKRLQKKGLVHKFLDKNNNTRQLVNLTEKGITAYKAHVDYHHHKHAEMKEFLDSLNTENKQALQEFLKKAFEMIDDHL